MGTWGLGGVRKIVFGFLSERELILKHKGESSGRKAMPGGGQQGKLGLFLFLILINAVGYPNLEKNLGANITEKLGERAPIPNIHMKYVDELLCICVSVCPLNFFDLIG